MNFEFVYESARANDAAPRRQVRRHAAKGHNAGKSVARSKGRPVIQNRPGDLLPSITSHSKGLTGRKPSPRTESPNFLKRVGDDIGVVDVSVTWTACRRRVHEVVAFLLNPVHAARLSRVLAPDHTGGVATAAMGLWVRLMFTDEACMHSTMAAAIIALNNARMFKENVSHAYHHFGIVLQSLNKKLALATSEAVSDATMAAVIIATQYERYRNAYANGVAHLEGVKRMIAMRGGFAAVAAGNPILGHKVLRADLEYSLHLGSPTKFTVDEMRALVGPGLLVDISPENEPVTIQSTLHTWLSLVLNPALHSLLDDMRDFTRAMNGADEGTRPKFDAVKLDNEIISFGYRLTDICPLDRLISPGLAERLIHVGLGTTLAMLLLGLDARPLVMPHLLPKILSIRDDMKQEKRDADLHKIWLWVVLTAESADIFRTTSEQAWALREVACLKDSLTLSSWKHVEAVLLEFPWARCLHGPPASALWNRAERVGFHEADEFLAPIS